MPKKSNAGEEEAPKKIASYTVKLDDAQMEKLRSICVERGWTPFEVGYTRFAFKAVRPLFDIHRFHGLIWVYGV